MDAAGKRNGSKTRLGLSFETLEARVVPALTTIPNSLVQPYSAAVVLEVTFPNGRVFAGSGALIDANSVLTAGHTMYSQVDGGWAMKMTVWAGYNNGVFAAKTTATQFVVDSRYIAHEQNFDRDGNNYSENGDIGIVTLKSPIGATVGAFDIERADSMFNFQGATRMALSYPAESPYSGETQYLTSGPIANYDTAGTTKLLTWNNRFDATGLTLYYGGQSGSPIFREVGGRYFIDAVFVAATTAPNSRGYGVLLTDALYDQLIVWRTQDNTSVFSAGTNQLALVDPYLKVATQVVKSGEYYSKLVTAAYNDYLGRQADAYGLSSWVAQMSQGLSDERMEAGFIGSNEYISTHGGQGEGWVRGMYSDLLGRTPDDFGVQYWLQQLGQGATPFQIAYGFAASAEREGQRITAAYLKFLNRPPESQAVINSWVTQYLAGKSNEDVIAGFISSREYYAAHGSDDTSWLRSIYLDVLDRNPLQSEITAWLRVL